MRTRWIPVLFAATSLMAACGEEVSDDENMPTEEDYLSSKRAFAATDLRLELDATVDGATVVVAGVVTNHGSGDSLGVRVRVEVGAGLAPPDPLGTNCVLDNGVMDCLVQGYLAPVGSSPDHPEEEVAEFQLVMSVDREVLAADGEVTLTAVVTADDLDLDNDTDPLNNTSTITVVIPAS